MLTKDALEWLDQHSGVHADRANAAINNADGEHVPFIPLPKGIDIHSLEKYLPAPRRFRGVFTTEDIMAFSSYVVLNDADKGEFDAVTFIYADKIQAMTYFDVGDVKNPGHGEHMAALKLEESPEYSALMAVEGKFITQQDAAEWLETYRHVLTPVSGINMEPYENTANNAIAAVRNIDIKATSERGSAIGNFSAEKSAMEKIEATSKLTLPWGFRMIIRPYDDLLEREFLLRLSVRTGGSSPTLAMSVVGLGLIQKEIAREFAGRIKAELGGLHHVHIGRFSK